MARCDSEPPRGLSGDSATRTDAFNRMMPPVTIESGTSAGHERTGSIMFSATRRNQVGKGSIAICFVRQALRVAAEKHLNTDHLLQQAGIFAGLLHLPHAQVSVASYRLLWILVAKELDDEFFGLDSRRMKPGSFAMLCQSLVSCATLGPALRQALRFFALLLDDTGGKLSCDGDVAAITLDPHPEAGHEPVFAHETLLIMLHGLLCWLAGRPIPILSADFAYGEPAYGADYKAMYSAQLRFGQPATVIRFAASCLDLPVVQSEQKATSFLRIAPPSVRLNRGNAVSLVARLHRRLRALPLDRWPCFKAVAQELHMTPSTLRRRLDEEGQSFQSIKDQLRRDLAINYLKHSSKSVTEIAIDLGFAEQSAFHRAFKKWTGMRPGEYRSHTGSA
jgi:AraC-like DNA-binding protein